MDLLKFCFEMKDCLLRSQYSLLLHFKRLLFSQEAGEEYLDIQEGAQDTGRMTSDDGFFRKFGRVKTLQFLDDPRFNATFIADI